MQRWGVCWGASRKESGFTWVLWPGDLRSPSPREDGLHWFTNCDKCTILMLDVLEKTLESPLDCKEVQQVHSEGDQSWVFIGRTDAEAETPILWPPHAKS